MLFFIAGAGSEVSGEVARESPHLYKALVEYGVGGFLFLLAVVVIFALLKSD